MSDTGFFELNLIDVRRQPIHDMETRIDVVRLDGVVAKRFKNLSFPPKQRLELSSYPLLSNIRGVVMPKRFRHSQTDFFTLTQSQVMPYEMRLLRNPSQWQAKFIQWNQLSPNFLPLQKVLQDSQVRVLDGENLAKFAESKYDQVNARRTLLAKTALLNLFAKMMALPEPIGGRNPWFSFVKQILVIDRERFFAIVDPEMGEVVTRISENIGQFPAYRSVTSLAHFQRLQDNLPDYRIFRTKMFSIKTDERHGNLQFTMAPAKDRAGSDVLVLDADIDENGKLLNHVIDVILVHPITGGTHPFDIHEYLASAHPNLSLGYELV